MNKKAMDWKSNPVSEDKFRAVIVEDEEPARNLIREYLKEFPSIRLVGEYSDGFSGVKEVNRIRPALLFLDIQMPKLTGFELLELLDYHPRIIFTTAYDQYAIKAFEINAVDYLLKPFSRERFSRAVEKALEMISSKTVTPVDKLLDSGVEPAEKLERIVVRSGSKINVIPVQDIQCIQAQDDYVMFYTAEGKYLKQRTMHYFESRLDRDQFIRVHRSCIVNVDHIRRLELYGKESYRIHLKNERIVPVSKTGLSKLKSRLDF